MSVEDLTTSQIKRLRAYLQTILHGVGRATDSKEKITSESHNPTQEITTPNALQDEAIEEILRRFSLDKVDKG